MASPVPPRKAWSIWTAQVASHLIVILFVTGALAAFGISTAQNRLRAEIVDKLVDIARIGARQIPAARVALIRPGGESTRMVRRLQRKLESLREASGSEAIWLCSTDGLTLLRAGAALEIGAPCGLPPSAEWRPALAAGETEWFATSDPDALTALAPITTTGGELAILAVRSDAATLEVLVETRHVLYIVAGIDAFLAFLISLMLARWISDPIRRVAATADRVGGGEYTARVEVPRLYELSVLAESINTMAEQVEGRDRELKALAATVAHEVRNPLNSIKLLVSLLDEELRDAGHAGQAGTIEVLHDEIGRLSRFLDEFLLWSKPVSVDQAPVDAIAPATAAVRMVEADAAQGGVRVELRAPDPFHAALDRERLEQCLLNLVLNAVQASPRDAEVLVEVDATPERVRYRVFDRGPGIVTVNRSRLFEPFFTTRADGSGLGLSNAQAIVAAHRGTLRLDERVGGGTVAVVEIPRGQPT